ncbi:MAG: glucose-6-phosphate dehydrogenase [Spongiibacteraceae bacterium]
MNAKVKPDVDVIIFGGTGDLALRKLLPALFLLQKYQLIANVRRIIGLGRKDVDTTSYIHTVKERLLQFVDAKEWDEQQWLQFSARLEYHQLEAAKLEQFAQLKQLIDTAPAQEKVFYLATSPSLYGQICQQLQRAELVDERSRVVLEKPLGHNLETCQAINEQVSCVFPEKNTFRIDHYLGKETVQNLLALRFGNVLFHPLWNSHYVDNIQITVAESIGVEGRGSYYAKFGALRDMVQNHLLQVLCLVAMEPPANLSADAIRNEKVKVLNSLQPMNANTARTNTVRGQYTSGAIDGQPVAGFLDEAEYKDSSNTETFVAICAEINNWRWAGVPFYLRTGKRLSKRYSEIVVEFKKHAFSLFGNNDNQPANKLLIRIQPEQTITLHLLNKKPGLSGPLTLQNVELDLTNDTHIAIRSHDAYERLLLDVINSDQTLFMRRDEVESAWHWTDSILTQWEQSGQKPKTYIAGTMGPTKASALTERSGRSWHE